MFIWKVIGYVPALVALTAVCAPYSGTVPSGERRKPFQDEAYPQVFYCNDRHGVNLYGSTAFRTRHSRFFIELADSMRLLKRGLSDTCVKKYAILSFRIDKTGKVDSTGIECGDSSRCSIKDTLLARMLSWHFAFSPSKSIMVIQDISMPQRYSQSFFRRHRIPVIIGLVVLGVLLIF